MLMRAVVIDVRVVQEKHKKHVRSRGIHYASMLYNGSKTLFCCSVLLCCSGFELCVATLFLLHNLLYIICKL